MSASPLFQANRTQNPLQAGREDISPNARPLVSSRLRLRDESYRERLTMLYSSVHTQAEIIVILNREFEGSCVTLSQLKKEAKKLGLTRYKARKPKMPADYSPEGGEAIEMTSPPITTSAEFSIGNFQPPQFGSFYQTFDPHGIAYPWYAYPIYPITPPWFPHFANFGDVNTMTMPVLHPTIYHDLEYDAPNENNPFANVFSPPATGLEFHWPENQQESQNAAF